MTKMRGFKLLTKTVCKYTYEKICYCEKQGSSLSCEHNMSWRLKKGVQHNDSVSTHVVIITKCVKEWSTGISKE